MRRGGGSPDGASPAAERAQTFLERAMQIDPSDRPIRELRDAVTAGGAGDGGAARGGRLRQL